MKLTSTLMTFGLLAASIVAQCPTKYYDNSSPSGGRNAFPWGSAGIRYQSIVPNAVLGAAPFTITDLLVPGDVNVPSLVVTYDDIEIRMGRTTVATPGTDWNTNNPSPTTVYRGAIANVNFQANTWTNLGMPGNYNYTGGADNLCVEVIVWAVNGRATPSNFFFPANSTGIGRAFRYNWVNGQTQGPLTGTGGGKFGIVCQPSGCTNPATRAFYGVGCGNNPNGPMGIGNTHVLPRLGQAGSLVGRWGPSNSAGAYTVGVGQTNIDLGPLGAPGCSVYTNPLLFLGTAFNGVGDATAFPFNIPNNTALCNGRLNLQLAALWPGLNALRVGTSNAIEFVIGN